LLQIENYEDQLSGVHDANKILTPFINAIESAGSPIKIAVILHGNISTEKTVQTVMDMARSFSQVKPSQHVVVFYAGSIISMLHKMDLPFEVRHVDADSVGKADESLIYSISTDEFEFVCLLECSGMYHGNDAINLISSIHDRQVNAVWGSRRLSVSDVRASYQFRYQKNWLLGVVSRAGSHLLSLMYLLLYGHFISDTLSGLRIVKAEVLKQSEVGIGHDSFNQLLLCNLLKKKGMVFEMPVGFLPMSPEKVKRTSVLQGLKNIGVILYKRMF